MKLTPHLTRTLVAATGIAAGLAAAGSTHAAVIASQGFETSGDTWAFTPSPAADDGGGDTWAATTALTGGISGPHSGSQFWGMRDLDGISSASEFILTFDAIDLTGVTDVEITLQYNAINLNSGESLFYRLDTGLGFGANIEIFGDPASGNATTAGWTPLTIAIPDAADTVTLVLGGSAFNSGGDYGGYDTISISGDSAGPNPVIPEPASLVLLAGGGLAMLSRRRRA